MGLVVGANPLGQMIFSPLFGWWGNRLNSIRVPMYCSLTLFTIASATYSSLEFIPTYTKYWMLGSRFLVGVSSANVAVCRSYLSAATRISERTKAISMISLAQVMGFVIGPGLQAAVTPLKSEGILIFDFIKLDMYTAAGWINVLMSICNVCLFLPVVFQERKIAAKEVMKIQGRKSEKETFKANKPDYVAAWNLIVAFFVLLFNFVLLETLGTSLTMDQFAWSKTEALYYMGLLMSVGAILACITFVGIGPLCKIFAEENVLIWGGFSLMVIGRFVCIPWGDAPAKLAKTIDEIIAKNATIDFENDVQYLGCPETQEWCKYTPALTITQFLLGYALTSIGYPIGITLIQTIFSKILGPRPQGVWMGLMTGSGCLSRVMGPVFVGYIYTRLGTYWTFGTTGVMMLVSMIWLHLFRKRLIPPKYEKNIELQELNPKESLSQKENEHQYNKELA
ncbi:major facilitator superfamily domain-containing protein 8 isoform X1 [Condylostylus longicornis]|nr:major facilitator superfamily domain-containing protein 8 isoform X1 [Condylostylus longicornis]